MNSEVPLARKIVFGIVIALVALLAAALFIRPAPKAAAFAGTFLDPSIPAKDFAGSGGRDHARGPEGTVRRPLLRLHLLPRRLPDHARQDLVRRPGDRS